MSAAEMREAAADRAERRGFATLAAEIRALPFPDEEGMVERLAKALSAYQFEGCEDYWEDQVDMASFVIRAITGGKP